VEFIQATRDESFVLVKKLRPDKRKGVTPRTLSVICRRGAHGDKSCKYQTGLDRCSH